MAAPTSCVSGWLHLPIAFEMGWPGRPVTAGRQLPQGSVTGQGFCRGAFKAATVVTRRSDLNEEGQLPTSQLQARSSLARREVREGVWALPHREGIRHVPLIHVLPCRRQPWPRHLAT